MEARAPVRFVWRFMLRRVWQSTYRGDMRKVWRKVWCRVPKIEVSSSALPSAWDTQSITYADCVAFFEAVIKDSIKKLKVMLYETYGPNVTAELAKCYNEDGETPLLVAIRQQNFEMVKYLTQKLRVPFSQHERLVWKGVEYSQVPPLFAAILSGKTEIIRYLMAAEMQFGQTFTSINSLISSSIDRQQKIDILEILGAAYLCFNQLYGTREPGLHCWKEAMNLRNSTSDGWQVIPKTEVAFSSDAARKAFGNTLEFTTLEQLDQLNASDLQLFAQSVLVSQRILSNISPGASLFILAHLRQYVDMCDKEENYSRVICTAIVFFEYFQQHQWENLVETSTSVSYLIDLTTKSFKNLCDGPLDNGQEFTFANLMIAFEFASGYVTDIQNAEGKRGTLYDIAWNIFEMVVSIVEMFPQLNAYEIQHFKRCLYRFIRMDHRWGRQSQNFLHMVCLCKDPSPSERRLDRFEANFNDDDCVSSCYSDDEEDETDGSASGRSSCGTHHDDCDFSDDCEDFDMINVENQYPGGGVQDDEDNCVSSCNSDDEEDATDGSSASGCPSCGDRHDDCGPSDNDVDFDMIDVEDQYPEGEVRGVMATLSAALHFSLIRLFLELGADPNSTDSYGVTPLHLLALHSEYFDPVQLMMEHGGHVDQADWYRLTPLMQFQQWRNQLVGAGTVEPRLQALVNNVRPLICLAAHVLNENLITGHRVPNDLKMPAALYSFVSRH